MTASKKIRQCGFTLIELVAVVCILSILATLALVVYNRVAIDRYDPEAIATLNSISEQSLILISEWGLGKGIDAGCYSLSPTGAGADGSAVAGVSQAASSLSIRIDGTQHWFYQVCFGLETNGTEVYVVSAHRITPSGNQRVLVAGSGFSSPVVAYTGETAFGTATFSTPSTTVVGWVRDMSTAINGQ